MKMNSTHIATIKEQVSDLQRGLGGQRLEEVLTQKGREILAEELPFYLGEDLATYDEILKKLMTAEKENTPVTFSKMNIAFAEEGMTDLLAAFGVAGLRKGVAAARTQVIQDMIKQQLGPIFPSMSIHEIVTLLTANSTEGRYLGLTVEAAVKKIASPDAQKEVRDVIACFGAQAVETVLTATLPKLINDRLDALMELEAPAEQPGKGFKLLCGYMAEVTAANRRARSDGR